MSTLKAPRPMTQTAILTDYRWAWEAASCAHERARDAADKHDLSRMFRELETEVTLDRLFDRCLMSPC